MSAQTIQTIMDNNSVEDEVKQNVLTKEEQEDDEEEESELEEESEEEEDEEEDDPWEPIKEEVLERHKTQREALIEKFKESGDSQEVAVIKADNSLLPLYRTELRDVLLEDVKWMKALNEDDTFQAIMETRDQLMEQKGYDWLESTELAIDERRFLLNRMFEAEPVPEDDLSE